MPQTPPDQLALATAGKPSPPEDGKPTGEGPKAVAWLFLVMDLYTDLVSKALPWLFLAMAICIGLAIFLSAIPSLGAWLSW